MSAIFFAYLSWYSLTAKAHTSLGSESTLALIAVGCLA